MRRIPTLPRRRLILIALVRGFAWFASSCYPSDQTIARKIGMSVGHVGRCLKELEAAGYIRRTHTRTGRVIWLCWRCASDQSSAPVPTQPRVEEDPCPVPVLTIPLSARGPSPRRGDKPVNRELEDLNRNVNVHVDETRISPTNTSLPCREILQHLASPSSSAPAIMPPAASQILIPSPAPTTTPGTVKPIKEVLTDLPGADECHG